MMLLIRHASAGDSSKWDGDDRLRPLDERGRRQARALVDALAGYDVEQVLSSPYLRCVQTVEPLAAARGLPVEHAHALGAHRQDVDAPPLLRSLAGRPVAVCAHGGVEDALGLDARFKKGATLVLAGGLELVRSIPPAA